MKQIAQYLKDVHAEMGHVSWPTRRHVMVSTAAVVVISVVIAAVLGLFDAGLAAVLERFVI